MKRFITVSDSMFLCAHTHTRKRVRIPEPNRIVQCVKLGDEHRIKTARHISNSFDEINRSDDDHQTHTLHLQRVLTLLFDQINYRICINIYIVLSHMETMFDHIL